MFSSKVKLRPEAPDAAPFALPWHGEVFALAVHLNEAGQCSWTEWEECFGANLARHNQMDDSDTDDCQSNGYYQVWLQTLIEIMQNKGLVQATGLAEMEHQWRHAYQTTPHGQPVKI